MTSALCCMTQALSSAAAGSVQASRNAVNSSEQGISGPPCCQGWSCQGYLPVCRRRCSGLLGWCLACTRCPSTAGWHRNHPRKHRHPPQHLRWCAADSCSLQHSKYCCECISKRVLFVSVSCTMAGSSGMQDVSAKNRMHASADSRLTFQDKMQSNCCLACNGLVA